MVGEWTCSPRGRLGPQNHSKKFANRRTHTTNADFMIFSGKSPDGLDPHFWITLKIYAIRMLKCLEPQNLKNLAHYGNLLDQLLSRNHGLENFMPENPPSSKTISFKP